MKKSKYFLKDKRAQIYKKMNVAEEGDMPREAYIPISPASLWCYTSQLSQDLMYRAKGVGENETRFFVFNFRDIVEVGDAVLYRAKWYNITRVDTTDDYNGDLFIYVENMSEEPEEEDILTYDEGAQYL